MVGVRFFDHFHEVEAWYVRHSEASLVSVQLPLLSNLNMQENIALIDEVHRAMSTKKAQSVASAFLAKLGLDGIALKRVNQCSDLEVFATMLLRAERMPLNSIYIVLPFTLIGHMDAIDQAIKLITLLDSEKLIEILELNSNRIHYQGRACHILE